MLQRQIEDGQLESLVLTLYNSGPLGISGREQSLQPSAPSAEEARLLIGCDPTSARYEVIVDPPRALLYAELRRRFPMRFAAPR